MKVWIGDRKCIYLQGINDPTRASNEVLSAVMETSGICSIVLGSVDKDAITFVEQKYGKENVSNKIFFAGNFPVLKVPQYMKLCCATLVFYKNTSINNWYCEANRLYQAVDMGLPAVVGANPTMKATVEQLGIGVSVATDGSDSMMIAQGLSLLLDHYSDYKSHVDNLKEEIRWKSQEPLLYKTFESLFNYKSIN